MENLLNKSIYNFKKSLFKRLGLLVVVFTITLTSVLLYQFEFNFTTKDTMIDTHEYYFYSEMVGDWGSPPDTLKIIKELDNLKMWGGIFKRNQYDICGNCGGLEEDISNCTLDSVSYNQFPAENQGIACPGDVYWSTLPEELDINEVYTWSISTDLSEKYDIQIAREVFFGDISGYPVTVVDGDEFLFYLIIDYITPGEERNIVIAFLLAFIFILGLYFFIRRYLRPVQLMKNRINALEEGDLKSTIKILGEDELADLSKSINKLIRQVDTLLEDKHQLLLEVSHELRSPLARMQFLIEMLPEHKNSLKLRQEVNFLEGMIDNLLLSDRLSMPYSKLEFKKIKITDLVSKVLELFPIKKNRIEIKNSLIEEYLLIDETKFIISIRNLLDNALKYGGNKKIQFIIQKNENIEFHVKDFGIGISKDKLEKIMEPFYQTDQSVSNIGFGLGLTICKKIIESHKGSLKINSKEGEGSTFSIFMPIPK